MNKDITFIYADAVQKQVFELIANEAQKRGYKTRFTDDKFAKCEIGWYCEHVNFPQYSKFSVIMLHDITQQYGNWPDIWLREPWNKYDVGFLPSKTWVDNWQECSKYFYARPRKGVYLTGWPKADKISEYINNENKEAEYKKEVGIDINKPTILYAPAWENDHKQDDFVQAMLELDVNILVKQPPWPDSYKEQLKNIKEMYELHQNNSRVIQLDPKTSILDAIMISDVLVSEESSTMCEAVMMGKPAVSVCNWLIPDVVPSRYPSDEYDYVIKTKKENLTECIKDIIENYDKYQKDAQLYSDTHFSNIGKCISMMLDIIDAYVQGEIIPYDSLTPSDRELVDPKKLMFHVKEQTKRALYYNYTERYKVLKVLRTAYHNAKSLLKKQK